MVLLMLISISCVSAEDNATLNDADTLLVSINTNVGFEYPNDINPDFYIVSANGENVNFVKTSDSNSKNNVLTFNRTTELYNVTAMASGYISQTKAINISNPVTLNFNLKASDAYKLGWDLTSSADKLLDFKNADDILVITSAGVAKYHGVTSEDAIEAVLNYGTSISYSNVLMLRETATDPIDFAFITRKGNLLKAVIYEKGSTKYSYFGTISENMTRAQWNNYLKSLSGSNGWSFASLANGWAAGVSREVLQEAAFHGHICEGTLGGFSIVKALLKYYPPVKETSTGGGSPGDITSYKILGVPGGSDDDAAIFFLDATIGKIAYVGIDTTATGATENMIGFIRWNAQTLTGDLIIMSFDSDKLKSDFMKETGINPNDGSLEELKYDTWWITKINNNPEELATFLYEFTNLTEEQYYYLMGTASDVVHGDTNITAIDSHGLDMKYILSLNLPKATRNMNTSIVGTLTDEEIKQIGIDAANKALNIFKNELGVDIEKDDVDFGVFTSAGYVYLNGQETVLVREGLVEALGTTLYKKNLLQFHQALWKPLWFVFIMRYPGSDVLNTVYLRYNDDGSFFVGNLNGSSVVDIGLKTLNNSAILKEIQKTFMPDGNWFSIQSIANAWKSNPNFDQILSFLYHNHVCPGVQPGFFITDYIQNNYPINENESYTYIASSTYCKDDSLTYLLGISPGMGDYIVQKLPNKDVNSQYVDGATDEGALIIWDNKLNIGRVVIISFKWPVVDTSMYSTSEAKRAAQIQAFIDLYKGLSNDNVKENLVVKASEERWINAEQFAQLKAGSGELNTMSYIKSLDPSVTKEDLIKAMEEQKPATSSNNTNSDSNTNANTAESTDYHSKRGSNAGYSGESLNVGTSSVGLSGDSSYAENSLDADSYDGSEISEDSSNKDDSKSYDISKKSPKKSVSSNNLVYAIILVLVIGVLLGVGYIKTRK